MKRSTKTKNPRPRKDRSDTLKTWIVFLLDRSGSMASCKAETIKGFNSYMEEVSKNEDLKEAVVSLYQFDSMGTDLVRDKVPVRKVPTMKTFEPRANTPLYDAMGKTISGLKEGDRDVIFITLTDGIENASEEWRIEQLRDLIKAKEKAHWSFVFIGIGKEAFQAGKHVFAGTQSCSNVTRSAYKDTGKLYASVSIGMKNYAHQKKAALRAGGQCVATSFFAGTDQEGSDND